MVWSLAVWFGSALLILAVLTQRWWDPWLAKSGVDWRAFPLRWYLLGFPATVIRIRWRWKQVCLINDLSISRKPTRMAVGDLAVRGTALRPIAPSLGLPRVTRTGLVVRVRLNPGQTPRPFLNATGALEHAWRVHRVRISSPRRGELIVTVTAQDSLSRGDAKADQQPDRFLAARVGRIEDGGAWVLDLREIPHWLLVGATQSGKSTLLAAWVVRLAPQRLALVGIDCKGGLELGLVESRLSALACNRPEAIELLRALVQEMQDRMAACRAARVRSIWQLPESERPVPIVVLVDELAELYLSDGSRESRDEVAQCATLLLRVAQLGAALGLHLVVAGQRVGSELGPGVTALRAQLGGRIAHRVNDEATAEMALGDLSPDAIAVAQTIEPDEKGVAVTTVGGRWMRARSDLTTPEQARTVADKHAHLTPHLPVLAHCMTGGGTSE
ncbi:FtsK/SpoIIIE domain-containing protein [Streptomyces natalensis]|uniref:Cell division protein FtsK n=1 Tax=Streptomyces natalensis ATCC 27448 TaxID=1240678 RepID=A0A0D7CR95_9ACTN|nr:FtsK/SpoIIIE domain-containing protein [Streptomyces natalensis]KIZ17937.1 cell division protein FtsK [Streptomyces natalensis ATCC 27448]